jgi:hypothetical protein
MNSIRAAFYARVSSEQQATAHTIESQLTALAERAGRRVAGAAGAPVCRRRIQRRYTRSSCNGSPARSGGCWMYAGPISPARLSSNSQPPSALRVKWCNFRNAIRFQI